MSSVSIGGINAPDIFFRIDISRRYCGHSTLMGKQKRAWQDVDYVLGYYGDTRRSARTRYFSYVEEDIFRKGKHQERVKARSLFCYWMVRELGASLTDLAKRLDISVAGVGYSVDGGEKITRENNYRLLDSRS